MIKLLMFFMMILFMVFLFGFIIFGIILKKVIEFKDYVFSLFSSDKKSSKGDREKSNNETIILDAEIVQDSFLDKYIKDIERIRKNYDDEINKELYSLVDVLVNLKKYLNEHREKEDDIKTLCDHYIPEMIEQLKLYKDVAGSSYQSESVDEARSDIINTIKLIREAFSTILSELYDNVILNISSNLDALKASIKLKGLAK